MSRFKRKGVSEGSGAFSDLLKSVFCPVCGGKLSIVEVEGVQRKLVCNRHGEMNCYLPRDPKAEFSSHCDAVGVVDVEVT